MAYIPLMEQMKFVGHYLIIAIYLEKQFLMNKENLLNEALNRYFKSVKESHPNLIEREILEIAANLAIKEVEKKLGEGTKLINTNDGPISRVDHKWQQEKGSNISNDGFFIAEEDLRLRGGGEVLGTKQSGFMDFRLANPYEHHDLLLAAADDAKLILHQDPHFTTERGKALCHLLYLFEYDKQIQYAKAG